MLEEFEHDEISDVERVYRGGGDTRSTKTALMLSSVEQSAVVYGGGYDDDDDAPVGGGVESTNAGSSSLRVPAENVCCSDEGCTESSWFSCGDRCCCSFRAPR